MRISSLLSLLLAAASPFAFAQQCTTSVVVSAFDAKTKAVLYGLTADDFAGRAGHTPLRVVSVKPVFRNRVLILVDQQGMDQNALETVADLVREAPPGMPLAFGIFADHAVFTRGFITDPGQLSASLEHVVSESRKIGPRPAMAKALNGALKVFGAHQPGDTILLVTNGTSHASRAQLKQLHEEFRRRGTRLQLLMGVLPEPRPSVMNASQIFSGWNRAESFSGDVIRLANSTGGVLMGFMNSEWMQAASAGYMLSISAPLNQERALKWTLRLRDAGNDVPPADLFYPERLEPCATPLVAALPDQTKPRP